jgi:hypothetical protein
VVAPPCIVSVGIWIVLGKIVVLSHIICLLLICKRIQRTSLNSVVRVGTYGTYLNLCGLLNGRDVLNCHGFDKYI